VLVVAGTPTAVGSIRTRSEKDGFMLPTGPHLTLEFGVPSMRGGGVAMKAVPEPVDIAVVKDGEGRKFVAIPHRVGILVDKLGVCLHARLDTLFNSDQVQRKHLRSRSCGFSISDAQWRSF
jgi:hypothetical protein